MIRAVLFAPDNESPTREGAAVASKRLPQATTEDLFLGYRIRKLGDVYVATPQEWAQGRAQLLAAASLPDLRREIERWWYEVGA